MYLSGGLRCLGSLFDGPRTNFLGTGSKVADKSEKTVTFLYEMIKSALLNAEFGKKLLFLFAVKLAYLCLKSCAYADYSGFFLVGNLF